MSHDLLPSPATLPGWKKSSPAPFLLHDLPPELQQLILNQIARLPATDLHSACRVSLDWYNHFTPTLYTSVAIDKDNRERVFHGLGLDFLTASALESRATEDGGGAKPYASRNNRKAAALAHVQTLTVADPPSAIALAEALVAHDHVFHNVKELELGAQFFRYLVNSHLAAFGRPRSGPAFVGETLVARLRPRKLMIDYPTSKGAGVFDPVLLARVLAVLLIDWSPEQVDYRGVGSDFPPVLGPRSRIYCTPCVPHDLYANDPDTEYDAAADFACRAHGALVRMHLRRVYGVDAHEELLDAIAEGADPTDDNDLDPDEVPDPSLAHIEYYGVPCIAQANRDVFLDKTFAHWPAEVDVGSHVAFYA